MESNAYWGNFRHDWGVADRNYRQTHGMLPVDRTTESDPILLWASALNSLSALYTFNRGWRAKSTFVIPADWQLPAIKKMLLDLTYYGLGAANTHDARVRVTDSEPEDDDDDEDVVADEPDAPPKTEGGKTGPPPQQQQPPPGLANYKGNPLYQRQHVAAETSDESDADNTDKEDIKSKDGEPKEKVEEKDSEPEKKSKDPSGGQPHTSMSNLDGADSPDEATPRHTSAHSYCANQATCRHVLNGTVNNRSNMTAADNREDEAFHNQLHAARRAAVRLRNRKNEYLRRAHPTDEQVD
jgi:hypothetical protein